MKSNNLLNTILFATLAAAPLFAQGQTSAANPNTPSTTFGDISRDHSGNMGLWGLLGLLGLGGLMKSSRRTDRADRTASNYRTEPGPSHS